MVTNSGGFLVLVVLRCPEVPAHFERHFGPKLTRFGGQTRSYEHLKVATDCGGATGGGRRNAHQASWGIRLGVYPLNYALYERAPAPQKLHPKSQPIGNRLEIDIIAPGQTSPNARGTKPLCSGITP